MWVMSLSVSIRLGPLGRLDEFAFETSQGYCTVATRVSTYFILVNSATHGSRVKHMVIESRVVRHQGIGPPIVFN